MSSKHFEHYISHISVRITNDQSIRSGFFV